MDIWVIISSSAVIAALVSSIASFWINRWSQRKSYDNEYYKIIINKRIEAYAFIERQILVTKATVLDDDGKPYYLFFNKKHDKYYEFQQNLFIASCNSMWLSTSILDTLNKMKQLFLTIDQEITDNEAHNIEIGKKYYSQIQKIRDEVEKSFLIDFANLHDINSFFKDKKKGYKEIKYTIKK